MAAEVWVWGAVLLTGTIWGISSAGLREGARRSKSAQWRDLLASPLYAFSLFSNLMGSIAFHLAVASGAGGLSASITQPAVNAVTMSTSCLADACFDKEARVTVLMAAGITLVVVGVALCAQEA